jgi:ABC-2 type transport system ATP-binding protein
MTAPGIEVHDLTKKFGAFTAVDRVSFDVRRGEIFGFLGPNGAGKSTTIRMLCGILRPTSGRGSVGGFDIARAPDKVKAIIGYMSQRFTLYNDLRVGENIDFYGGIHRLRPSMIKERKAWVLNMAGLLGRENALTKSLSGGWKQRLALGCAILHNPEILFLDEPTASVDPASRRDFWDLIYELSRQGTTTLVTSHYMDEVERCHRLAIIFAGRIIALGSPRDLKLRFAGRDTATLEDVFISAIKEAQTP